MKLGFIGVDFFFVISGFLISYQLLDLNNSIQAKKVSPFKAIGNFIVRRGLRIFPLYYTILILVTLFNKGEIREAFFHNLTYTTNFYFIKVQSWSSTFSHFWSLSVEEHFYLIWPILLLFVKRRMMLFIMLGIAIFSLAFRYFSFTTTYDYFSVYIHTLSCLDLFMMGAILAYFLYHYKDQFLNFFSRKSVKFFILAGFTLTYLSILLYPNENVYVWVFFRTGFGLFCAGLIGLLVIGFKGIVGRIFEHRWLILGGKLSYAIYLLHNFVPGILLEIKKLELPTAVEFLIYFVATVLLSMLVHKVIEKPARRLGQRFKIKFT